MDAWWTNAWADNAWYGTAWQARAQGSGGPDPSIGPVQSDDEEELILRFIRDFLDKVA